MNIGYRCRLIGSFNSGIIQSKETLATTDKDLGQCFIIELDSGHEIAIYEKEMIGYNDPVYGELIEAWRKAKQTGYQSISLYYEKSEKKYHITMDKDFLESRNRFHKSLQFPQYRWLGQWPDIFKSNCLEGV